MRDAIYLVLERSRIERSCKNPPRLGSGQHAVRVMVDVDDRYFVRAIHEAHITFGENELLFPEVEVRTDEQKDGSLNLCGVVEILPTCLRDAETSAIAIDRSLADLRIRLLCEAEEIRERDRVSLDE